MNDEQLRYPVGRYQKPDHISPRQREELILEIAGLPAELDKVLAGLSEVQLDTPYRDGGWTVRQVVHHLADSHMNAVVRYRLAMTEAEPLIKPYDEQAWAELPDARNAAIDWSCALLQGLHARWCACLQAQTAASFARTFRHPERGVLTLDELLALYAWHGRHHLAHIQRLRQRMGW